jgi:uncharacterized membrane protein YagU involved in acid resistance
MSRECTSGAAIEILRPGPLGDHSSMATRGSLLGDLARGAVAGAIATWVMDLVTTGVIEQQSQADAEREAAAQPGGQSSAANLLERVEGRVDVHVPDDLRPTVLNAIHYGLGIGPGAVYAVVRRRLPFVRAGRGLLYGLVLFLVNDEGMNTALELSGPPEAYPASSHLRGLIGHFALGATTDLVLDVTGG